MKVWQSAAFLVYFKKVITGLPTVGSTQIEDLNWETDFQRKNVKRFKVHLSLKKNNYDHNDENVNDNENGDGNVQCYREI